LTQGTEADRDYLEGPEFESSYVGYLEQDHLWIARRNGETVGLGLLDDAVLDPTKACIGMYTNRSARRQGVGRSVLSLLSRDLLDRGRVPVAGCWWRNWASRAAIEAAGLTCVGTIFRMGLDSGRFRVAVDERTNGSVA
jgi:RimJ/RimL family protein N-acetyltransferase